MYEIKRNPNNYLEHLQYVNRLKKTQQLSEFKRQEQTIRREQGFQLQFSGANGPRIVEHRKREEKDRTKSPALRKKWEEKPERVRKRWGEPVIPPLLQPIPSKSKLKLHSATQVSPEVHFKSTHSQNRSRRSSIARSELITLPVDTIADVPEVSKATPSNLTPISLPISQRPKSSSSILLLAGSIILRPQTSSKPITESTQIADRIEKLNFEKRKKILNLLFELENDNFNISRNEERV